MDFLIPLLQSVSHEYLEIILIRWFGVRETFPVIINIENSYAAYYFCGKFCNNAKIFTVTFDQFNGYLLNKSGWQLIVLWNIYVKII